MSHKLCMEWDRQQPAPRQPQLGLHLVQEVGQPHGNSVSVVPPSPMDSKSDFLDEQKMTNTEGFLDLKRGKLTISQPTESSPIALALRKGFQGQKTKLVGELTSFVQDHDLCSPQSPDANLLPPPNVGSIDINKELQLENLQFGLNHSSNLKKGVETKPPPKTFHDDGPSLPLPSEEDTDWCGVQLRKEKEWKAKIKVCNPSLPVDNYAEGKILYGSKTALKEMVADLARLKCGTTGCIVDETCDPLCDAYDPEVHFLVDQNLGKGSFGNVDRCYDSKTQKPFIRKQIKKESLRSSEIIVPLNLNHRNITRFYGLIQRGYTDDMGNPTMELLIEDGGSALNRWMVYEGKTFTQAQIWSLTKQGLSALAHIDHYSIVHLDIKPENICVLAMEDGSLQLKVTDFGSSRLPVEPPKFVGVTPEYMAPEMCKIYLQNALNKGVNWNLTEADITGKVDMFAFGLVIMYMYKGYHILVKVINNGNTTYAGVDANTRGIMQYQLMMMLASDANASFVPSLTPDECDLDMRDLLHKMTEHNHTDRYSAKQALDIIEGKERARQLKIKPELRVREQTAEQLMIQKRVPLTALPDISDFDNCGIPGIAEDCMESENGPIKNRTKDLLRLKIKPYDKLTSKKAMYMKQERQNGGAVTEMRSLVHGIASKKLVMTPTDDVQATRTHGMVPQTPISEFESLNIGQTAMEEEQGVVPRTEFSPELAPPSLSFGRDSVKVSQVSTPQQASGGAGSADNNIISLVFKKITPGANGRVQPLTAQKLCIPVPPELLEKLRQRKLVPQSQMTNAVPQIQRVKVEPFPDVIDIRGGPQVQMSGAGHQVFRQGTQLATPRYQEQDFRRGQVGTHIVTPRYQDQDLRRGQVGTHIVTPRYQDQDLRRGQVGRMRLDDHDEGGFNSIAGRESPVQMDTEGGNIPKFAAFM